jgi:hypothetical protein
MDANTTSEILAGGCGQEKEARGQEKEARGEKEGHDEAGYRPINLKRLQKYSKAFLHAARC